MTSLGGYFVTSPELRRRGFTVGENVNIASTVCIYGDYANLIIGDNVRIDDHTVILANATVEIGSYVHISPFCYLQGGGGIRLADFVGLASHCTIMTNGSDLSGKVLTNPMPPKELIGADVGPVEMDRHSFLCAGVSVGPRTEIGEGSVLAAHAFAKGKFGSWGFYGGCPAKFIKPRDNELLELAKGLIVNH